MKKFIQIFTILMLVLLPMVAGAALGNKLKGSILLQVEENGEAWYINPANEKRYYMGRPADAFDLMRSLGTGITNKDLTLIPVADANFTGADDKDFDGLSEMIEQSIGTDDTKKDSDGDGFGDKSELLYGYSPIVAMGDKVTDESFAQKHLGKIFLQTESLGEAWYVNPADGKRYFLGRPTDAFNVMRRLGLGISNENLATIEVMEVEIPVVDDPISGGGNASDDTIAGKYKELKEASQELYLEIASDDNLWDGDFVVSSDGGHYYYEASNGMDYQFVKDGQKQEVIYDDIKDTAVVLNSNVQARVAFVAKDADNNDVVVVDGVEGEKYYDVIDNSLNFSGNGDHFDYIAVGQDDVYGEKVDYYLIVQDKDKKFDKNGENFQDVYFSNSLYKPTMPNDGSSLIYIAKFRESYDLYKNDEILMESVDLTKLSSKTVAQFNFSPDSQNLTYEYDNKRYLNKVEAPECFTEEGFDIEIDTGFNYIDYGEGVLVVNDSYCRDFTNIEQFSITSDGDYVFVKNLVDKSEVIKNGVTQGIYNDVVYYFVDPNYIDMAIVESSEYAQDDNLKVTIFAGGKRYVYSGGYDAIYGLEQSLKNDGEILLGALFNETEGTFGKYHIFYQEYISPAYDDVYYVGFSGSSVEAVVRDGARVYRVTYTK